MIRLRLGAAAIALAAVPALLVGPNAAPAAAFPATCSYINRTYNIQEGSVDVNTAKIDIIGKICRGTDGLFNISGSSLSFSIRTTVAGSAVGYSYWMRGVNKITATKTDLRWRVYVGYNLCAIKYIPACGPGDPGFSFDMRATITFLTYNGLSRSGINNNQWAGARWS